MQNEQSLRSFLSNNADLREPTSKFYYLSGTELSSFLPGRQELCFTDTAYKGLSAYNPASQLQGPLLSGGVFRNSFYHAVWNEYTSVRRVYISLTGSGRLALVVAQSASHTSPSSVLSCEVFLRKDEPTVIRLPNLDKYAQNGRLYWDLRSLDHDTEVSNVEFVTDQSPINRGRLVVLIRTYGRSNDVIELLSNLTEQAATFEHRNFLQQTKFIVLDTTKDALKLYQALLAGRKLNLAVMDGDNLGGGGNASQLLFRFLDNEASKDFDELILTDDDLDITLESLCRYRAFAKFRTKEVISTCPILIKSEPHVVWEDGGFWGRFHPTQMSSERISLFPRLLRHGWRLKNFDYVDDFGILNRPEYATFIFFAGPISIFRKLQYPAAFFLRGDDVEYSLRAKSAGFEMVSNPNVCAWHEPGHSYGQEYMAVLHGIVINLHYGVANRERLAHFFNTRMYAHSSIRDGRGLQVYVKVLEALTGNLPLLQPNFQVAYLQCLSELRELEQGYEKLDRKLIEDLLSDTKQRSIILPFLHMRGGDYEEVDLIILENHPQKTFFFRRMNDEKQDRLFYENLCKFSVLFGDLMERFDQIATDLTGRLLATQSGEFWKPIFAEKAFNIRTSEGYRKTNPHLAPKYRLPLRSWPGSNSPAQGPKSIGLFRRAVSSEPEKELPPGFDEKLYLNLNPDVANARMSARAHYLNYGRAEGRRWKLEGADE